MSEPIRVPDLGESVSEAEVSGWLKREGDRVSSGDAVVTLGTDKADLEVGAGASGVIESIDHGEGDTVRPGDVLGTIAPADREGAEPSPDDERGPEDRSGKQTPPETPEAARDGGEAGGDEPEGEADGSDQASGEAPPEGTRDAERQPTRQGDEEERGRPRPTPVASRAAAERGVSLDVVEGTGRGGRVTKRDVLEHADRAAGATREAPDRPSHRGSAGRPEERQPMSLRRRTIARRLVEAQQTAAALTTFNDVDMTAVKALRARHGERFQERHGVRLGITAFFVRASVAALRLYPRLNGEIQGEEMVLKGYYDVGVAVSAPAGLVAPVLRDADRMSLAEMEEAIADLAERAREDRLGVDDLRGGTFSITNGGVFGSLLSTPILNPPQVGILGLHRIEERPVAVEGRVEVRPMMYVALTYDHRIVDGREAVAFLGEIKRLIESPEELLLDA